MELLVKKLLASGVGTIAGVFRASPETTQKIKSDPELSVDEVNPMELNEIPKWFAASLSANEAAIGVISSEMDRVTIGDHVLGLKGFTMHPELSTFDSVMPISITYKGDEGRELHFHLKYDRSKDDNNSLDLHLDYSFCFRATLSQKFFWELLTKPLIKFTTL